MKVFHCSNCQHLLYFENVYCERCKSQVGFLPSTGSLVVLPAGQDAPAEPGAVRQCQNYVEHNVCNWAVDADDPNLLCVSCRLTTVIPNLEVDSNVDAWMRLEKAKRRLVYTLLQLKLPLVSKAQNPAIGLQFEFKGDSAGPSGDHARVLTGHDDGTIVINIAEADDAERERRRVSLNEPYRTLVGHMRHEIGHYYWDRLIRDTQALEPFRALFGDERADYGQALKRHYEVGAPADWQQNYVSVYASSHAWEDWAETWAHYLHISDTLETAADCGLSLRPRRADDPSLPTEKTPPSPVARDFAAMMERWFPVTHLLNMLNRGLGMADAYPFVLSPAAIEKLRFVHDVLSDFVMRHAPEVPVANPDGGVDTAPLAPAAPTDPAPPPAALAPAPA